MQRIISFFTNFRFSPESKKKDALHYFVTQTKSRDKKRVLEIVARKVNEDQSKTVKKAKRLTLA